MRITALAFVFCGFLSISLAQTDISACGCGQKSSKRIVGGAESEKNAYPFSVSIQDRNGKHFCGGSIINNRYILTAAHCMLDETADTIQVVLGDHNVLQPSETASQKFFVDQIKCHAEYNTPNRVNNDICVLRLTSSIVYTSVIKPVCLAPSKSNYVGQSATVVGWGALAEAGKMSPTQQELTLKVLQDSECSSMYSPYNTTTMLCFGATTGGKDACQGDSGGPLFIRDQDGRFRQIGITSFGNGCARNRYPGVYTKISNFLDWIVANTKDGVYCDTTTLPPVVTTTTPSTFQCGKANRISLRIAGGLTIDPKYKFPWSAVLLENTAGNYNMQCGATLIGDRWLTTAAHCVNGRNINNLFVVLGEYDISKYEGKEVMTPVLDYIIPADYDPSLDVVNDIALLKVGKVTFAAHIAPICLPPNRWKTTSLVGNYGLATGWGLTSSTAVTYSNLNREVLLQIISNDDCIKTYGKNKVTSTALCALGTAGKDVCKYDAGGAFMLYATDETYRLAGVNAFASGKCGSSNPPTPVGTTRVTSYLQWIQDNTGITPP